MPYGMLLHIKVLIEPTCSEKSGNGRLLVFHPIANQQALPTPEFVLEASYCVQDAGLRKLQLPDFGRPDGAQPNARPQHAIETMQRHQQRTPLETSIGLMPLKDTSLLLPFDITRRQMKWKWHITDS